MEVEGSQLGCVDPGTSEGPGRALEPRREEKKRLVEEGKRPCLEAGQPAPLRGLVAIADGSAFFTGPHLISSQVDGSVLAS